MDLKELGKYWVAGIIFTILYLIFTFIIYGPVLLGTSFLANQAVTLVIFILIGFVIVPIIIGALINWVHDKILD